VRVPHLVEFFLYGHGGWMLFYRPAPTRRKLSIVVSKARCL
jgi:hypothetical protein